jgi:4-hydroxy-2-oxoglutarate aldolase
VDLSGVHVPLVTPFDAVTGEVDLVALRANVRALVEHGVQGVLVSGSTGEAVYLDESERRLLIEAARAVVTGDRLLLAGVGAESTRATVRMARAAADAGADAVLVMPPAFYRGLMTPEALREHYAAVADASPVPVVIYQVPSHLSTVELATGLVAELARHGNVIGIKESRGSLEQVGDLLTACPPGFQLLVGSAALLYPAFDMGAPGAIVAAAHLAPGACVALYRAFREARASDAGRLQERVGPLHKEIVVRLGVPGIKAALDLLGRHGGAPRLPLRPLSAKAREEVSGTLRRAGLIQAEPSERAVAERSGRSH